MSAENFLAAQLRGISFPAPFEKRGLVFYNIHNDWGNKRFSVRMRIAGRQLILGTTDRLDDARRFADMANRLFIREGVRPAMLARYNYSAAQADKDLTDCPTAAALLGEWFAYLFPSGVPPKRKPTVRRTFGQKLAALEQRIADLERNIAALEQKTKS